MKDMSVLGSILLSSICISAISLIGGVFLARRAKKESPLVELFVGFAAGVMLGTALLELLPEALHHIQEAGGQASFLPVLLGILLFFFLERFVFWFHHHDNTHHAKPSAYLVIVGDSIHNFIDGIAIAAAFLTDIRLGFLTTFAIAAHEIPQELADLGVLIASGLKPRTALLFNFLSALTATIGAVLAYIALPAVSSQIPVLLLFTAGMFLYIACSDLIPELHRDMREKKSWNHSLSLLVGILVSLGIQMILPHE